MTHGPASSSSATAWPAPASSRTWSKRGGRERFDIDRCSATSRTATTTGSCSRACSPAPPHGRHRHQPAVVVRSQRRHAARRHPRRAARSRSAAGASAQTGSSEPYDTLVIATGSRPLHAADRGLGIGRRRAARTACSSSGRSTTAIGCCVARADAQRGRGHRRRPARASKPPAGSAQPRARRPHRASDAARHGRAARSRRRSRILQRQLEQMGLQMLLTSAHDGAFSATDASSGVRFADGSDIACDMVVVAAGIRPNVQLARDAGLEVKRGIVVGDDLACPGAERRLRDRRVRGAPRPALRPRRAALGTDRASWPIG